MMLRHTFEVDSGRTCIVVASFPPLRLPGAVHRTHHDRSSGRDYQQQDVLHNSVYPNKGILSFLHQHAIPDPPKNDDDDEKERTLFFISVIACPRCTQF